MTDVFRVGIHFDKDFGYIEYRQDLRKFSVFLEDEAKRQEVEKYLFNEQVIQAAQHTLRDFKEMSTVPTTDINSFKLALTRLWNSTGVLVDWSRPVD